MAPVNISGMPLVMVKGLRELGVEARLLQYRRGEGSYGFGYDSDILVNLDGRPTAETRMETVWNCLDDDYDVFHFWLRTLVFGPKYTGLLGLDLPFIKLYGRRIAYRFTGNDLRDPVQDKENNPYSLQRYGYWTASLDVEPIRKGYIEHLQCHVDAFVVQDPEMLSFMPSARVVPRSLELDKWNFVGIEPTDRPLVVHGPSNEHVKGTRFILQACEELKEEGLSFDLKLVKGMAHAEAAEWYRKADILVDQLHLGAYGVFSMEGMALGKSVICYYREDLFKPIYGDLPIINANPDSIKDVLRKTIKDFEMRKEYSIRGRAFVEEHHDHVRVAAQMKEVYDDILAAPPVKPSGGGDLKFLAMQYSSLEKDIARQRALARRADRRFEVANEQSREWRNQVAGLKRELKRKDKLLTRADRNLIAVRSRIKTAREQAPKVPLTFLQQVRRFGKGALRKMRAR